MDIFVRCIPVDSSDRSLQQLFRRHLRSYGIDVFHCNRFKNRKLAVCTVLDVEKATLFLRDFEQPASKLVRPKRELQMYGTVLALSLSRKETDPLVVRSLEKEAKDRSRQSTAETIAQPKMEDRSIPFESFGCGQWDYLAERLTFYTQFTVQGPGSLYFGDRLLAMESDFQLQDVNGEQVTKRYRIDFGYSTIQSMALNHNPSPSVTLSLSEAPRIYKKLLNVPDKQTPLSASLGPFAANASPFSKTFLSTLHELFGADVSRSSSGILWERVRGLTKEHEPSVSGCLAYRIKLTDSSLLLKIERFCRQHPQAPLYIPRSSECCSDSAFSQQMDSLINRMLGAHPRFSYVLRFQLQRLAQNGYLTPRQTIALLPAVELALDRANDASCAEAVRIMARHIPFAGADTEASDFGVERLSELLIESLPEGREDGFHNHAIWKEHSHIRPIYRIHATPAGIYLEGPEPETINRVIRQAPGATDHFLRVEFCDEDFERLKFERSVSLKPVIRDSFKTVLDNGLHVAGRHFDFLGFSHSSLRNQTAWFMSPTQQSGQTINARDVISQLGDFSGFHSPAKCAARIGQAFTDTTGVIQIPESSIAVIEDVERNDRCFSDGVGTVSASVLASIWEKHPSSGRSEPSMYQVRRAGAKGMLALDNRLDGYCVNLRETMIKFKGSPSTDLEICGASTKPISLYLNRQYVKIFEDLGVPERHFMELQSEAIAEMRRVTTSPIHAARFLDQERVCQKSGTARLIRNLSYVNCDYRQDPFLRGLVELAILARLREMKHRARIRIDQGSLLYGIMDETAVLEEGEIFCSVDGRIITGRVVITRAPALHPGDAQMVNAVAVSQDSPLAALDNCIVFSQKGSRDLPSQLSGGDLDGDQYAIIWDSRLLLPRTVAPADYARADPVDIGRPVTATDMSDFFLNFMENDQLGRIATLHVQLADLHGTEHPDCIRLAEMHSTAVDFSKTGIPVDMSNCPKASRCRPDFMMRGPRAVLSGGVARIEAETSFENNDSKETDDELDPNTWTYSYFESQRVLGKLYREIDEREFLKEIQSQSRDIKNMPQAEDSLMLRFWHFVQKDTAKVEWTHLRDWAIDVKESYEARLLDTIHQYSVHPTESISEVEVFAGTLLGRDGAAVSRRARKANNDMKEKFDLDVSLTLSSINKGSEGEDVSRKDALARAIACLAVGVERQNVIKLRRVKAGLQSFKYIAAAVCLVEMNKRSKDIVVWPGRSK